MTFAGSGRELEERLVAARGMPYVALPARPLVGRSAVSRLRALGTLTRSTLAARRLLASLEVDVVVGTGGYASAPAVLAARLAGRPSLLVEPNASAGVANRWLSRWASAAAVAQPETVAELRCPSQVTGAPVRERFFSLPEPVRQGPLRLLVLGGSQGSQQLNREVPAALAAVRLRLPALRVLHQAGQGKVEETREAYSEAGFPTPGAEAGEGVAVEVVAFVDDVAEAMGQAELLVSRAGALTTAEIAAAGRASVLVPLALAGGHQRANAGVLAAVGAARVVGSEGLGTAELGEALAAWLEDPEALAAAGRAARSRARPGAASAIADLAEQLAGAAHRRRGGGR